MGRNKHAGLHGLPVPTCLTQTTKCRNVPTRLTLWSRHFSVSRRVHSMTRASDSDSYPGAVTALREDTRCPPKSRQKFAQKPNNEGKAPQGGKNLSWGWRPGKGVTQTVIISLASRAVGFSQN